MNIEQHIQAIIFSSDHPVTVMDLVSLFEKLDPETEVSMQDVEQALRNIKNKFIEANLAFELKEIGGGYQMLTKSEFHEAINTFLNIKARKLLSNSALETLSIIAYKQPVTKLDIEHIRGVNCDYTVQKLLEKDLIEISGKKNAPGKPLLYSVSQSFLDYFGINSTEDLPQMKEVEPERDNEIGEVDEH